MARGEGKIAATQLLALFIVLCVLGLANSLYLVRKHYQKKPLVCPLEHDCSVVTEGKWSHVFGIRNELLGSLFFLLLLGGALSTIFVPVFQPTIFILFIIGTGGSLLFSGFLIFVQIRIIKDYCFYCLLSALITIFLFLNSLLLVA